MGEDTITNKHYYNLVRQQVADSLRNNIKTNNPPRTAGDSVRVAVINNIAASLDSLVRRDTIESIALHVGNGGVRFELREEKYSNVAEYDSIQNTLPADKRDKGFMRWMLRTNVSLKSRYGSRSQVVLDENFEHNVPKMMFVLLPLFALFIFWFHNRKNYYYAQHVIFSIHFHSFMFVLFLIITLLGWVFPHINAVILLPPTLLILFIYFAVALKVTYNQALVVSMLKAAGIGLLYIISLVICIIVLAFIDFFTA